jgi:hypothetical protein
MAFICEISYDALRGPDYSTWEWKQGILEKLQVERTVRDLIESVVSGAENEASVARPVARVLFSEWDEEESLDLEISEDDHDNLWIDTRRENLRRCEICSQDEWCIWERIRTGQGEPIDSLREHDGRLMCGCCEEMLDRPFSGYNWCCNCFVSEKMARRYGISMIPLGGSPEEHVCSVCNDIYPDMAECMEYGDGEWSQLLDGTWVLDEENVYEGEYENEDARENNTEIAKGIKETVSKIGENIYDIQGKISEGEYLKLMDLLQKVTNDVNKL